MSHPTDTSPTRDQQDPDQSVVFRFWAGPRAYQIRTSASGNGMWQLFAAGTAGDFVLQDEAFPPLVIREVLKILGADQPMGPSMNPVTIRTPDYKHGLTLLRSYITSPGEPVEATVAVAMVDLATDEVFKILQFNEETFAEGLRLLFPYKELASRKFHQHLIDRCRHFLKGKPGG